EGPPPLDAARVRSLLDHLHRREIVPDRDRALPDDRVRERATGGVVGLAALGDLRTPRQPEAAHRAHPRALDGAAPEHRAAPLEDAPEVPEHLPYSGRRSGHRLAHVHFRHDRPPLVRAVSILGRAAPRACCEPPRPRAVASHRPMAYGRHSWPTPSCCDTTTAASPP